MFVELKSMCRPYSRDLYYLLYPGEWQAGKYNNYVSTGLQHKYSYRLGNGEINIFLRSSSLYSDYSYSQLGLQSVNTITKGKFDFKTRLYMLYGTGENLADESALYLASSNPEQMMNSKYTRSRAFIDHSWLNYGDRTNHYQQGGGLNLRAYAGYLSPEVDKNGKVQFAYKGNSGASVSAEMDFERLFQFAPYFFQNWLKLDTYVFADAGVINYGKDKEFMLSGLRADAGIGACLSIKKWGDLQAVDPLSIRFDIPIFINSAPATEPDYIKYRWVVGIGRSF